MVTAPTAAKFVRWIQGGLLVLIAVMPFHAFLSVWLGHSFGHQAVWQSWKEALVAVLIVLTAALIRTERQRLSRWRNALTYLMAAFMVVAALVTVFNPLHVTPLLFGIKTDIEFLVVMLIAQLVTTNQFVRQAVNTLMVSSTLVLLFGLLQIYALPNDWLAQFGYGPTTIEPFLRVDPAVDSVRILSTLGGPNQLGSFLVLPLALAFARLLRRPRWWHVPFLVAGGIVMIHSYSRGAWLGLAIALLILILIRLKRAWRLPTLLAATLAAAVAVIVIPNQLSSHQDWQYYVFHESARGHGIAASTTQHFAATQEGIQLAKHYPLGQGLGTAGPASFHSAHTIIPENYYLQLAIETGLLGAALFVILQVVLGWRLWQIATAAATWPEPTRMAAAGTCAALIGIGVINLFLHGWADSSTALVFWTLAGAVISSKP